jgi:chromate transporter
MAGYGVANAIPGPLFAFSAYLGAVSSKLPNGWSGAVLCLVAAFLPSFLLILGVLPFWEKLRVIPKIRQAMLGLNAAVVGILLAALYKPVWISAIFSVKDFVLAATGFFLIERWKTPSWLAVLFTVGVSFLLS